MKNSIYLLLSPLMLAGLVVWSPYNKTSQESRKTIVLIGCGPARLEELNAREDGKFIVPLPGWGNHFYRISTENDSAQYYFNQGLSMYYSYHMREAIASFKEASRFDPSSAMCFWGQALSMGPTYNFAHYYTPHKNLSEVQKQMNEATGPLTDKERLLVKAMNARYAASFSVGDSNDAYLLAMRQLSHTYPDDNDIKALFVDAVMLVHPWDFWNNDGSPKPWTLEAVTTSEQILRSDPNHPAALHYHIHLTEASRHPEVGLTDANRLKALLPGVAHMVHMSSHEYERNGWFAAGVEANDMADEALHLYDSLAKNISLSRHVPHYFAVQTYCDLSGGMYEKGLKDAIRCRLSVSPTHEDTYDQYLYMFPQLLQVRLGKWQEILSNAVRPPEDWAYASLLDDFARGLAFVYTGKIDSAKISLSDLQATLSDTSLQTRDIPFNRASQGADIAEHILRAAIAFSEKRNETGIKILVEAARKEDSLIYREPKDWMIPARQFLGAYLFRMGRFANAERVYREDLVWNPGNGWSLLGLYQSLKAQGKMKGLANYKRLYMRSFSNAHQLPPGSVYLQ